MPPDNLDLEVELIKKDIVQITKLVDKFDTTIDKLQQIASDITKVVSLQEQKIQLQDRINIEVDNLLERQQKEQVAESKELRRTVDEVEKRLAEKLNKSEESILKEIQAVKEELNKKINSLEAWRYMVMGIISVVVFLVSQATGLAKLFMN